MRWAVRGFLALTFNVGWRWFRLLPAVFFFCCGSRNRARRSVVARVGFGWWIGAAGPSRSSSFSSCLSRVVNLLHKARWKRYRAAAINECQADDVRGKINKIQISCRGSAGNKLGFASGLCQNWKIKFASPEMAGCSCCRSGNHLVPGRFVCPQRNRFDFPSRPNIVKPTHRSSNKATVGGLDIVVGRPGPMDKDSWMH